MPRYIVTGSTPYNGHAPGETFDSEENESITRALIRGSIDRKKVEKEVKRLNVESHRAD